MVTLVIVSSNFPAGYGSIITMPDLDFSLGLQMIRFVTCAGDFSGMYRDCRHFHKFPPEVSAMNSQTPLLEISDMLRCTDY